MWNADPSSPTTISARPRWSSCSRMLRVSGCAMVHHASASRRSAGAELRSRTGLPILLRDSQSPVARNLSRPLVAAQELGVLGAEPVVVAVADVRDVQKVESGGVGDDPRGVLDHEDVEYLRLPRLRSNPAGYVPQLTGMSMKSPSSVHCATSSARPSISRRDWPAASPPKMMFSRPERSWLNPTPSASRVLARPQTSIEPQMGGRMPAIPASKLTCRSHWSR
jgi:hypothetical protein